MSKRSRNADPPENGRERHERQVRELEQEMKLLKWHKLANEAALKAAIIRTNRLKDYDVTKSLSQSAAKDKMLWMQQIIEEEQGKPIEVNEEFIREFRANEELDNQRMKQKSEQHVESLRRLTARLKKREELKERNRAYREEKNKLKLLKPRFDPKQPGSASSRFATPEISASTDSIRSGFMSPEGSGAEEMSQAVPVGNLSTVLNSLDRLVELEKRIALLESSEASSDQVTQNSMGGSIHFSKKRQSSDGGSAQAYYRVKFTGKSTHSRAAGAKKKAKTQTKKGGRIGARLVGARKKDAVITRWLDKSKEKEGERRKKKAAGNKRSGAPARKANTARSHIQHFHDLRKQFDKRKRLLQKRMHARSKSGGDSYI